MTFRFTIADQLGINASVFPERPALEVIGGECLTYAAAWQRTIELAVAIREATTGAATGRVGLLLPNSADAALAYLAVQLAGCTSVPVNGRLSHRERSFILQDSEASMLLTAAPFLDEIGELNVSQPLTILDAAEVGPVQQPVLPFEQTSGDEGFIVGYTSGTTGFPKGTVFSADGMLVQYHRWGWQFSLTAEHTLLTPGPIFHMSYGGLCLTALMAGATTRIMQEFDPVVAVDEFSARSSWSMLIPSMATMIMEKWKEQDRGPMEAARFLLSSGAPVSVGLLEDAALAFPNAVVAEAYGWSEGGWVTFEVKDRKNLRNQCVGWPMMGVDVRVLKQDGTRAPVGEPGEIAVKNITPFMGYLNRPDATAEAETKDGYLLSGDVGIIDDDGRIRLVDRLKDMIVTGGENVFSAEVERVLIDHPSIQEVAIVGEEDARWGEAVVAYVVAEAALDVEDLRTFCRKAVAGYKVPKRFYFVDELPRNSMGKVQKFKLRRADESS